MSATEQWNDAIKAEIDKGKTKENAIRTVVREQPELHAEYLAEVNKGRRPRPFQPAH